YCRGHRAGIRARRARESRSHWYPCRLFERSVALERSPMGLGHSPSRVAPRGRDAGPPYDGCRRWCQTVGWSVLLRLDPLRPRRDRDVWRHRLGAGALEYARGSVGGRAVRPAQDGATSGFPSLLPSRACYYFADRIDDDIGFVDVDIVVRTF